MSKIIKKAMQFMLTASLVFAASGLITVATAKAQEPQSTPNFKMIDGCSVRVSDSKEKNGIRFSAEVNGSWFDTLTQKGNTLTAGTFIMPYNYIEKYGTLNEANCFGDTALYTWAGKEEINSTAKMIIHMESLPYKVDNSSDYRINGSVVNMRDENLDRDYVGVCYIKAINGENIKYYFADTNFDNNNRSIIGVSQKILLNETSPEKDIAVANEYLETYITNYKNINNAVPTRTYNEEYYVNCSTGYEIKETRTKTVDLNTAEDFKFEVGNTNPVLEGYRYDKNKSTPSAKLALDNSAKVQYYFDRNLGGTIFNGADIEHVNAPSAGNVQTATINGNEFTLTPAGAAPNMFVLTSTWSYYGEQVLYCHTNSNGWHKIEFTNDIIFPCETDTISLLVKNVKVPLDRELDIETNPYAVGKISLQADKKDEYRVDVKLSNPISTLKDIEIWAADHGKQDNAFYMEDIKPVFNLKIKDNTIKLTKENANSAHSINIRDILLSSIYSEAELSQNINVVYKNLSTKTSEELPINDGKINFTTEAENSYLITINCIIGGKEISTEIRVLGYYEDFVTSFEADDYTFNNPNYIETVSDGVDGNRAIRIKTGGSKDWAHYIPNSPYYLKSDCTKLCMWIYSPSEFTQNTGIVPSWIYPEYFYVSSGENIDGVTHFYAGWNYYEIDLGKTLKTGSNIANIQFYVEFTGHIQIDYIAFK